MKNEKGYSIYNAQTINSDRRYKTLSDIFDREIITRTQVRKDLGIHNQRFNKLLSHPNKFMLDDLIRFAELIDLDVKLVVDLAINQWEQQKKENKRKGPK